MVTGFAFLSRLTQIAQPHTRFVFLGAGIRLGLPSHPASRRRSCLRLGVSTTSSSRGLSPPIDRPCRAYSRVARSAITEQGREVRRAGLAWSRRHVRCSRCTRCCGWPWWTRWRPARALILTGPASPPPWKPCGTSSPPPAASARTARRPARRHRPGRPGHLAARAPPPVQRPKGQMRHLPVPEPRRRLPGPAHPTTITAIDIAVCTPPVDLKPGRTHRDRRSTPAHLSRPPAGS